MKWFIKERCQVFLIRFITTTVVCACVSARPNDFGSPSAWLFKQITIFNICGSNASALCSTEVEDCLEFYGAHYFQPQNTQLNLNVICASIPFPECILKISRCTDLFESRIPRREAIESVNQQSYSPDLSAEPVVNGKFETGGFRLPPVQIEYDDAGHDYYDPSEVLHEYTGLHRDSIGSDSKPGKAGIVREDGLFIPGVHSNPAGFGHGSFVPPVNPLKHDASRFGGFSSLTEFSEHFGSGNSFDIPTGAIETADFVNDSFGSPAELNDSAGGNYGFFRNSGKPSTLVTDTFDQPEKNSEYGNSEQESQSISEEPSKFSGLWDGGFEPYGEPSEYGVLLEDPSEFSGFRPSTFELHQESKWPEESEYIEFGLSGEYKNFTGLGYSDIGTAEEPIEFEHFGQGKFSDSSDFGQGDLWSAAEPNKSGDMGHVDISLTNKQIDSAGHEHDGLRTSVEFLSFNDSKGSDLIHATKFNESSVLVNSSLGELQKVGDSWGLITNVSGFSNVSSEANSLHGAAALEQTNVTEGPGYHASNITKESIQSDSPGAVNFSANGWSNVSSGAENLHAAVALELTNVTEGSSYHAFNITKEPIKFDGLGAVNFSEAVDDNLSILYICAVRDIPNCHQRAEKCSYITGPHSKILGQTKEDFSECLEFIEAFVQTALQMVPDPPECEGENCRSCELSLEPTPDFIAKVQACSTVLKENYTMKQCMRSTMEHHIRSVTRAAIQPQILSALKDCYQEYNFEQIYGCLVNACSEII